jgi:hypothetical protein
MTPPHLKTIGRLELLGAASLTYLRGDLDRFVRGVELAARAPEEGSGEPRLVVGCPRAGTSLRDVRARGPLFERKGQIDEPTSDEPQAGYEALKSDEAHTNGENRLL